MRIRGWKDEKRRSSARILYLEN